MIDLNTKYRRPRGRIVIPPKRKPVVNKKALLNNTCFWLSTALHPREIMGFEHNMSVKVYCETEDLHKPNGEICPKKVQKADESGNFITIMINPDTNTLLLEPLGPHYQRFRISSSSEMSLFRSMALASLRIKEVNERRRRTESLAKDLGKVD